MKHLKARSEFLIKYRAAPPYEIVDGIAELLFIAKEEGGGFTKGVAIDVGK